MTEEMDQPLNRKESPKSPAPIVEDRTFLDVLESLMGRTVTMINPESYEDGSVGQQIRAGFYRAKLIGRGIDYLIVVAEYFRAGKEGRKEPVKQFIPIGRIKRISMMKGEWLLHI